MVFFLGFLVFRVVLVVCRGFSCFFLVLHGFRALDHQNHCKNQEKPQILDLRDSLKMVFFLVFLVFTVVLVVCRGFWWFSGILQ